MPKTFLEEMDNVSKFVNKNKTKITGTKTSIVKDKKGNNFGRLDILKGNIFIRIYIANIKNDETSNFHACLYNFTLEGKLIEKKYVKSADEMINILNKIIYV